MKKIIIYLSLIFCVEAKSQSVIDFGSFQIESDVKNYAERVLRERCSTTVYYESPLNLISYRSNSNNAEYFYFHVKGRSYEADNMDYNIVFELKRKPSGLVLDDFNPIEGCL